MKSIFTCFKVLLFTVPLFFFGCKGSNEGFAPSPAGPVGPLAIAPASATLAVNNLESFSATGGTAPYTFSVFSGSGTVLPTTGSYTAPGVMGSAVVRVTDSKGAFADAVVTVNPALQISPTSQSLSLNATQTFTASGGVAPFVFSRVSGSGTINATTGVYTAPNFPASASVRVTDARGNTATASVNIYGALGISPTSTTLAVNNIENFTAAGGVGPYTFSIILGTGVINAASGVYTAPATAGMATVQVTDSLGATASASVTINAALQISPVSQTTLINSSITFTQTGGVSPFIYSVISAAGTGTIDADTGVYTAPASNAFATIRVTDSLGNISDANVTVTTTLTISPASTTLAVNNTLTFSAVGGTGPFTFSRPMGTGIINATTGVYTAPAAAGSAVVRVTDSLGAFAEATITVNAALAITPATQTMGINGTLNYSASGGVVPYSYAIVSGGGVVNGSTGVFTAPAIAGTTVVRVTDNIGNVADSTVTVTTGLSISPASVTLAVNNTATFVAANGATPYTFSILSGTGTINATTGLYTAPVSAGSAVVRVTDNLGATANANVTINAALAISPATKTLAVNNTFTFTATGGVSPYSYSVVTGTGTINAASGLYTAPAAAGTNTVRVTDGLGNISNSTVTINAALAISPATATIGSTSSQTYTSSGGVSPFSYSITSGPGTIVAATGVYTASSAGSVTVRSTDSLGNISNASLTVTGPLVVTPATAYVITNSDLALAAAGGVSPYSYAIVSGGGLIDVLTGVYTAPATVGTATLRTSDSATPVGTFDTSVTIYEPLTLSPLTLTIAASGTQTFSATGGFGARTFSVTGTGTINSTTGLYTAPVVAGTDIIQVMDTIGNIVQATVTIVSQLSITPASLKLPVFSTMTFGAVLGTAPYSYSVTLGTGTINATSGLYTAPSTIGAGTVRVTDNITNFSNAAVTHIEPTKIVAGANHTCVLYNEGSVKCFGDGASGQLGQGSTGDLADVPAELGGNLPFLNLGTGRTAVNISSGFAHTCALLDNATVKCWGLNSSGQLGIGNTANRGDGANEMGDNLPAVNLGAGRSALKVHAMGYQTCVIMDTNATKCFGLNSSGQLGLDDTVNRGTTAAQMGDSLPAVNLGVGRTAVKLDGGFDFTCALLDNSTVKCFGGNRYGQLGTENTLVLGNSAGEMAALTAINLGTGRTATDIGVGYSHACAVLDNGTAKCWGRNNKGQLGIDNGVNTFGDSAGEMGDNLPAINFTAFTPVKIFGGNQSSCAINAAGGVRCWGNNASGQLLIGSIASQGDNANELPALTNVNLGTGVVASSMTVGYSHACVITTTKRMKCWGIATNGSLGNGTITPNLGDAPGELGDALPFVNH